MMQRSSIGSQWLAACIMQQMLPAASLCIFNTRLLQYAHRPHNQVSGLLSGNLSAAVTCRLYFEIPIRPLLLLFLGLQDAVYFLTS